MAMGPHAIAALIHSLHLSPFPVIHYRTWTPQHTHLKPLSSLYRKFYFIISCNHWPVIFPCIKWHGPQTTHNFSTSLRLGVPEANRNCSHAEVSFTSLLLQRKSFLHVISCFTCLFCIQNYVEMRLPMLRVFLWLLPALTTSSRGMWELWCPVEFVTYCFFFLKKSLTERQNI